MIAANKVDLSSDRQISKQEGDQFAAEKLGDAALHMETSGKNRLLSHFQPVFQPKPTKMSTKSSRSWSIERTPIWTRKRPRLRNVASWCKTHMGLKTALIFDLQSPTKPFQSYCTLNPHSQFRSSFILITYFHKHFHLFAKFRLIFPKF